MRRRRRLDPADWQVYLLIIAVFLPLYVFLYAKIIATGYAIDKKEERYQELAMINKGLSTQYMTLLSPESLKNLVTKFNIPLEVPADWSLVEIRRKPEDLRSTSNDGKAEANTN